MSLSLPTNRLSCMSREHCAQEHDSVRVRTPDLWSIISAESARVGQFEQAREEAIFCAIIDKKSSAYLEESQLESSFSVHFTNKRQATHTKRR